MRYKSGLLMNLDLEIVRLERENCCIEMRAFPNGRLLVSNHCAGI